MKVAVAVACLAAQISASWAASTDPDDIPIAVLQDAKYTIVAEGIRAQFVAYGASLTNLFINDTNGIERDIVVGFENGGQYERDRSRLHLGAVLGRYANRIKKSSSTLDGKAANIVPNKNRGITTLHGGPNGWGHREFEEASYTTNSIVFRIEDRDGGEGLPGTVTSYITYMVTPYRLHVFMNATSTEKTPIMLSSHVYWNLDGFQNPSTNQVLNHSLELPYSDQSIAVDDALIPTGQIISIKPGSVNDFWTKPKHIGEGFNDPAIKSNCGAGCNSYDNSWLINRTLPGTSTLPATGTAWWEAKPVAKLRSEWSGIQANIYTDQDAFYMNSCNFQNGALPIKLTQGFLNDPNHPRRVPKYACVVTSVLDWIDGINNPSWKRETRQTVGPQTPPYTFRATYEFAVSKSK